MPIAAVDPKPAPMPAPIEVPPHKPVPTLLLLLILPIGMLAGIAMLPIGMPHISEPTLILLPIDGKSTSKDALFTLPTVEAVNVTPGKAP
mmetsp:Transcript_64735/g.107564  ORF Transcript_64735/g.107564 Transcript_64735/m.107564 type:complete len:90 (+) Transcript_64735:54-323(+)